VMQRPNQNKKNASTASRPLSSLARAPRRVLARDLENSIISRMVLARRLRRIATSLTVGSVAVLGILTGVATFSPLLAIQQVTVVGTERLDPEEISKALASQIGKPLPLFNQEEIADSLAGFSLIESFTATALPPNELQVKVSERQGICIVEFEGALWLHDPAGVRIALAQPTDLLPRILVSEVPSSSQRFRDSVDVLLALPVELLAQVEIIQANTKDDVQMSLRGSLGQRISWGDSSDAVLKSKVLQALMANNQGASGVTFDVSSPNAPVVRFDNF
jgi:cell division protein FtsQ